MAAFFIRRFLLCFDSLIFLKNEFGECVVSHRFFRRTLRFTTGGLASYRCGNAPDFIGDRKQGFLFRTRTGTPFLQSNFLRSSLYPILEELGIEKQGFHGFRRFRVTHLESSSVPPAPVKYWTGHAKSSDGEVVRQTITDRYIKMAKDSKFRAEVAERIGLGFELPKAKTVEVVPRFQKTEVTASI
jgi:hypothetical protein